METLNKKLFYLYQIYPIIEGILIASQYSIMLANKINIRLFYEIFGKYWI